MARLIDLFMTTVLILFMLAFVVGWGLLAFIISTSGFMWLGVAFGVTPVLIAASLIVWDRI